MGIVTLPSFGTDPATVNAANLDGKVDPLATEFNGSIENVNVASAAAIGNAKLNLASIAQVVAFANTLTMTSKSISEAEGSAVASATTTESYITDGNFTHITGTTTITSLGTAAQAGDCRTLVFDGALTLTHNATSLILPGGANITTAAGDVAIIRAETTANTRVIAYLRKDGSSLALATAAEVLTGTDSLKTVTASTMIGHEGVAKAWGTFNGSGTPAFIDSFNMDASITDNGTGDYSVTFTTDFGNANYAIGGLAQQNSANSTADLTIKNGTTPATTGVNFTVADHSGTQIDPPRISFIVLGDR